MVNKMTREEKILKLVELSQNKESCVSEEVTASGILRVVDGDLQHLFEPLSKLRKITIRRNPSVKNITLTSVPDDYVIQPPTKTVFGVEVELIDDYDFDEDGYLSAYLVALNYTSMPMSEFSGLKYFSKETSMHANYAGRNIYFFKNESDAIKVAEAMNQLAGL